MNANVWSDETKPARRTTSSEIPAELTEKADE